MMTTLRLVLLTLPLLQVASSLSRENFEVQPLPIRFIEEPYDWIVSPMASFSLSCNTSVVRVVGHDSSTPLPQFKWFHNNSSISSGSRYVISGVDMGTSILSVVNVSAEEQGYYHCIVSDWLTKTRSISAHVSVIENDQSVNISGAGNVMLSCGGGHGTVWMKNGIQLTDTSGEMLLFDEGQYQCINPVTNTSYHVIVWEDTISPEKPVMLSNDSQQWLGIRPFSGCSDSGADQSISLHCQVTGDASIIWYRNGELVSDIVHDDVTGVWNVTRRDLCDLLGTYQCFASNAAGTVHSSTRVLPYGWANRPGRPRLIDSSISTNKVTITMEWQHPEYLGGLSEDQLEYDIYGKSARRNGSFVYIQSENDNIATISLIQFSVSGLESISNYIYLTVQLRPVDLTSEEQDLVAQPKPSSLLSINPLCDLYNLIPPDVTETCHYNETSDLVMHNISWRVEGSFLNYRISDYVSQYRISGGCSYPNGSVFVNFGQILYAESFITFLLPQSSTCNISVLYSTVCFGILSSPGYHGSCSYEIPVPTTDDTTTGPSGQSNKATDYVIIGVLTIMIVAIIIVILIMTTWLIIAWRKNHRFHRLRSP